MAFRGKEMMKKIMAKIGGEKNLAPGVKQALKQAIPNSKVVMNRAKRGLFAGRHIQFGNQISEDGGNKSRRSWKAKYKAGGIDEYLLKTPYHKMDTEMGILWKAKIEKLYEELGNMEVVFFTPEAEADLDQDFKDMRLEQREARKQLRRQIYGWSGKQKQIEEQQEDLNPNNWGGNSHDISNNQVANYH
ncbi:39S RIBOSOMAL PROTEIN L28 MITOCHONDRIAL [Salix viminalis]|uniref:39S RIBOSOMAL PROTEIN L28 MITOCHONDRIAL n=1 Tax=Salix viminalis TaxID=40686 RepID=A0A9Q0NQ37_SALVM|nr:39S RIBOSOMAL PROTEIN L28 MITOCHONDRIAL [Salix viminalis]